MNSSLLVRVSQLPSKPAHLQFTSQVCKPCLSPPHQLSHRPPGHTTCLELSTLHFPLCYNKPFKLWFCGLPTASCIFSSQFLGQNLKSFIPLNHVGLQQRKLFYPPVSVCRHESGANLLIHRKKVPSTCHIQYRVKVLISSTSFLQILLLRSQTL